MFLWKERPQMRLFNYNTKSRTNSLAICLTKAPLIGFF